MLLRFKKEQPFPKLTFNNTTDAENFLDALILSTDHFVRENSELWKVVNL